MKKNKDSNLSEILTIDPERGWTFNSEDELLDFFKENIQKLEDYYLKKHKKKLNLHSDFFEKELDKTLEDPDEVWIHLDLLDEEYPVYLFKRRIPDESKTQIACCYCFEEEPTFIFTYFVIGDDADQEIINQQNLIYDRSIKEIYRGAIEGDSLFEGDELAVGLYRAMMLLRSELDIKESEFKDYDSLREETIEEADEIWRSMDSYGKYLVHFIKEYQDESGQDFYYIAVTVEDEASDSNILLFSFPTTEESLVERYRIGESLHAEDVSQENSH